MVRNKKYLYFIFILVIKKIKLYQEPTYDDQGNYIKKPLGEDQIKIKLNTPLKEGVLTINCGVPLVFVINKSDVATDSTEKKKFEENSEFILHHIRSLAIGYGATIVYTSGYRNLNLNILYDYICHTFFNFDLIHKPNLTDIDAYYIPAGYDNLTLLKSNDEQKQYLNELYEKKITPTIKKIKEEEDIQCEDTNTFFENLKKMGVKGKDTGKNKLSSTSSFVEPKRMNMGLPDIRNYETNISSNRNLNEFDKDKKYADKRKEIKEKISINSSFTKGKEKGKDSGEEKKKRVREEMLAKIKRNKLSKPLEKKTSNK